MSHEYSTQLYPYLREMFYPNNTNIDFVYIPQLIKKLYKIEGPHFLCDSLTK